MKKYYTFLFLITIVSLTKATVYSVNNNTNAIGMFASAQEAIDAAFVGDTVFLHASSTSYGDITVAKRITLLGEGYSNSSDGIAKKTEIRYLYLDSIAGGDPVSGLVIDGLIGGYYFPYNSGANGINNVVFKNCYIPTYFYVKGQNWEIINCNIGYMETSYTISQIAVHNTIIRSSLTGFKGGIFSNCVIGAQISNCSFVQFSNCVFTKTSAYQTNSNNIAIINSSFNVAQTINANASNTATNCLFEVDPRFVNTTHYQLKPDGATQGSVNPLIGAGADGTDIGVTGGTYPITIMDGRTDYPQVHQVEVTTGVIAPGENLIINVHARTRK